MSYGESDTRAKLIDPAIHKRGWTEDLIRREETAGAGLGIGVPGEVLYLADLDMCGEKQMVMKVYGFEGAVTNIIEGKFPIDYLTCHKKRFEKESFVLDSAEKLAEGMVDPETILVKKTASA